MDRALAACGFVLLGLAAIAGACAADENAEPNLPTAQPSLLLELVDPGQKPIINSPVRLKLTIVNGGEDCKVQWIGLSIPQSLTLTAAKPWGRDQDSLDWKDEDNIRLRAPGQRSSIPIDLVPVPWAQLRGRLPQVLTYTTRKETFFASIHYTSGAQSIPGDKETELSIDVEPSQLGMYAGALLGLVLGSVFLVTFAVVPSSSPNEDDNANATKSLHASNSSPNIFTNLGWRIFRGTIATALAILVFQTTSNLNLITISVHDFYGGVVLGLFADKTASLIYQRIQETK